ncbi:acyltransferase [Lichenihabitans sp. Uapishka_5]|uniref:acyltransferase family protein n=1 Tax=Lichenihabitans sp. Uapishka_5 TaxID=3037302 RepID=UPI0029E8015E|nr:acyltransferase [Lichenihabitans sp. Uapishka_5]MDX7952947.1 acyltransferase [Lichenihabitans sp. Uapishka_5]
MTYIAHPPAWLSIGGFVVIAVGLWAVRLPRLVPSLPGRLASIDGLRGVLAMCVFYHHFFITYQWKHTGRWEVPPTHLHNLMGGCSVVLFFMITGFLFFGRIKAARGAINLNAFFAGRVFRLLPVYGVTIVLIYAAALRVTGAPWSTALQPSFEPWIFFQSTDIAGYPATNLIDAGVHWTLAYEWTFYLALPLLAFAWTKLRFEAWALFLLSVAALLVARLNPVLPPLQGLFVAPFALGGLVGEIGRLPAIRRHAAGWMGTLVCAFAALTLFLSCDNPYSVFSYLILLFVFAPIACGNTLFGLLRTRTMLMLGEISYSLYMLHGLVLFGIYTLVLPDALSHASTPGRLFSLLLIASAGAIAAATLVHLAIERPALRLGRRFVAISREQQLAAP